ncbi:MAG: hypothetical protein H6Q18_749, partial [Bacteroidetes bacterium]|nr:hypothetical protein [Bacteroidota bacterium]
MIGSSQQKNSMLNIFNSMLLKIYWKNNSNNINAIPMVFDIEMIREVYKQLPVKVKETQAILGRPLT